MHFYAISALSLVLAPVLASAEPRPYPLVKGALSAREVLQLFKRQDSGYAPTSTDCFGSGTTCAEVCGAGKEQCPSNDGQLHCFDPTIKQVCCSDGSGLGCDTGYFCTQDNTGAPWCCPDGMDLATCAASYGVTGLSSLAAITGAATSAPPTGAPTTPPPASPTGTAVYTSKPLAPSNTTIVTPTIAPFKGAGNARAIGGLALPIALAGAIAAL